MKGRERPYVLAGRVSRTGASECKTIFFKNRPARLALHEFQKRLRRLFVHRIFQDDRSLHDRGVHLRGHFPTARIAPPAKYFHRTPTWLLRIRRFPHSAAPRPPRARKAHAPDSRWQSFLPAHPATHSIPVSRHPRSDPGASKSRFAPRRIRRASPAPRGPLPPAFADIQCPRKRTGQKALHYASARKNFRSIRTSRLLSFPPAFQTARTILPSQTSSPPPLPHGSLGLARAPRSG